MVAIFLFSETSALSVAKWFYMGCWRHWILVPKDDDRFVISLVLRFTRGQALLIPIAKSSGLFITITSPVQML